MPRSAVHPDLAVMRAQNDAVVAKNSHARTIKPQARSRAFPRAGMPEEKMPATLRVRDPDGMNFHAIPARKAVNHQQFVERILKRINRPLRVKVPAR